MYILLVSIQPIGFSLPIYLFGYRGYYSVIVSVSILRGFVKNHTNFNNLATPKKKQI